MNLNIWPEYLPRSPKLTGLLHSHIIKLVDSAFLLSQIVHVFRQKHQNVMRLADFIKFKPFNKFLKKSLPKTVRFSNSEDN